MSQTSQSPLVPFSAIEGVYTVPISVYGDERGNFCESFRKEWFPQTDWSHMQTNRSISKAGVLRGLHYHFHQVDYWFVMAGSIRVGLADLRPNSPTFKTGITLDLTADTPQGLFIPVGVAHGFYALTDMMLVYVVNQYYNGGKDENGVAWDDPQLGVNWDVQDPILSKRDMQNPLLEDIAQLPQG